MSSSASFYNQILTRLDTFLSPSNNFLIHTPNEIKRSPSFSPDLHSLKASNHLSTSERLKKLASSIKSIKEKQFPLRNSDSSFTAHLEPKTKCEKLDYMAEISNLSKMNEELRMQLSSYQNNSSPCACKQYNHNAINALLEENEELKKFKENVFVLSKRYDDINEDVLESLQQIDMLFTEINHSKSILSYNHQAEIVERSRASFENVINKMVDLMKNKQAEYNYLIAEKEREIYELIEEKKAMRYARNTNTIEENIHNNRKQFKNAYQSLSSTNNTKLDEDNSSPNMDYKRKIIRKKYSCN